MAEFDADSTSARIDAAIVAAKKEAYRSAGIPMSALALPCDRATYYAFRWVSALPEFPPNVLRIFETGEIYEERLLDWLEAAGVEVQRTDDTTNKQIKVEAAHGFVRGKLDGRCYGLIEAPKTPHTVECKSHNQKSFDELRKLGVRKAKEEHFCQIQVYMYLVGDKRGLYMAVNKNTDELYLERVEIDVEYVLRMLNKAEIIASTERPPERIGRETHPACKWCDHKPICHKGAFPQSANCRTCVYAEPLKDSGAKWQCTLHEKPLTYGEQMEGCSAHLFLPDLIPGEVVAWDEENHKVTYKLKNGKEYVDGGI